MKKNKFPVCPYNSGVECPDADCISAKCGKCAWNTDLTILPMRRLTDRFTADIIAEMRKAEIFCEKDGKKPPPV